MTDQLQQKTIIDPELSDVLALQKQDVFASLNCVKVGNITAFDATKKTAQIQILFKRQFPDGTTASYPILLDCPVFTLQGGGAYLQMPIAAGDQCIVLFSDRSLDEWYQNGAEAVPSSPRMHDMSDAIAIVGINALNSAAPATPSNKAILSYQGSTYEINSTGIKAIAAGGAELDLQAALVTLKNGTTTLLTLVNAFITLLEAAQVQGPAASVYPFTTAYIALLEAYKLQFATLLG